jgi:hypothetical protein
MYSFVTLRFTFYVRQKQVMKDMVTRHIIMKIIITMMIVLMLKIVMIIVLILKIMVLIWNLTTVKRNMQKITNQKKIIRKSLKIMIIMKVLSKTNITSFITKMIILNLIVIIKELNILKAIEGNKMLIQR